MCLFGLNLTLYSSNFQITQVQNKFTEHVTKLKKKLQVDNQTHTGKPNE